MPVNSFDDYPMSWRPSRENLSKPFYRSLATQLEADIRSGVLPKNAQLPPQRELADFLDLNLSTITRAYKICELKGLLYAVVGRGTFVSPGVDAQDTFMDQHRAAIELGIIKPFYQFNSQIAGAARKVLDQRGAERFFEYGDPMGSERQRDAAVKWLRFLGVPAEPSALLIAAGAQNALAVVLISLFRAGDKIAVDEFTYTNFKGLAGFLHIQLVAVKGDGFGMLPEALEAACKQSDVRGVYAMPTCSNPTGVHMPQARREQIVSIAKKWNLLIIEDDIYSFLAHDDAQSLFSLAPERTIHVCSVSKSICAGVRVAFMAFPDRHREALVEGTLNINLKTVSMNAGVVAELIDSGAARQIVAEKIRLARRRNEVFFEVFPGEADDGMDWFFRWMRLPDGWNSEELEVQALRRGVHLLGSHRFAMTNEERSSYVRLSLVSPGDEAELRQGLETVKRILERRDVGLLV